LWQKNLLSYFHLQPIIIKAFTFGTITISIKNYTTTSLFYHYFFFFLLDSDQLQSKEVNACTAVCKGCNLEKKKSPISCLWIDTENNLNEVWTELYSNLTNLPNAQKCVIFDKRKEMSQVVLNLQVVVRGRHKRREPLWCLPGVSG
jgi:hypothetical protein